MSRRWIARVSLIVPLLLGLPTTAIAEPPPVESFDYTSNLVPLGASLRAPSPASDYNSDLAFWGNKAYQGTAEGFRIIDISDPADPVALNNYDDCKGSQGDVIIWENILVRSWNSPATATSSCDGELVGAGFEGLHIFDISNPADPREIAYFNKPLIAGTTSTYPTKEGAFAMSAPAYDEATGDIWYTDGHSGFYVVRLTGAARRTKFASRVLYPGN